MSGGGHDRKWNGGIHPYMMMGILVELGWLASYHVGIHESFIPFIHSIK